VRLLSSRSSLGSAAWRRSPPEARCWTRSSRAARRTAGCAVVARTSSLRACWCTIILRRMGHRTEPCPHAAKAHNGCSSRSSAGHSSSRSRRPAGASSTPDRQGAGATAACGPPPLRNVRHLGCRPHMGWATHGMDPRSSPPLILAVECPVVAYRQGAADLCAAYGRYGRSHHNSAITTHHAMDEPTLSAVHGRRRR